MANEVVHPQPQHETIADIFRFVKEAEGMMTAVKLNPSYCEKKKRVSKGESKAHYQWNKRGWVEKNVRQTPSSEEMPYAWMLDLKKLGLYVVDVDVKDGKKGAEVLKKEVYQRLYQNSAYVVETGSGGLHFYYRYGPMEDGDKVKNKVDAECANWLQSPNDGSIDFIVEAVLTQYSKYSYEGKTYEYKALKGKLSEVAKWEEGWSEHKGYFVENPRLQREMQKEEEKAKKMAEKESQKMLERMKQAQEEEAEAEFQKTCHPISAQELLLHLNIICRHTRDTFSYRKWYELGQTLKNLALTDNYEDEEMFEVFDGFSANCPSYDGKEKTYRFWNTLRPRTGPGSRGMGSILFLSREANLDEYTMVRKKYQPMGYQMTKEMFEENHFYFIPSNSIAEIDKTGQLHFYDLEHAHKYMNDWICYNREGKAMTKPSFTEMWMADGKRRKIRSLVAKKMEECGEDEYPIFTRFHYQNIEEEPTKEQEEEVQATMQDLILSVCDDDLKVAQYITYSLADILQNPFRKTGKIIAFASRDQGTGKDSLMEAFGKVVGPQATAHYTSTEQFWDKHDTLFVGKPFVYLEEACSRQNKANEGRLKARATASDLSVNPKGLKPSMVPNIGRMWMTTNETDPFRVDETDRRGIIIKPSTRLMKQDWGVFYAKMAQSWFIKAFGTWLEGLDLSSWSATKDMPTTERKKDIQEASRKTEQVFLERWVSEQKDGDENVKEEERKKEDWKWVSASALYRAYREFCVDQGFTPKGGQSFGMALVDYKGRYFKTEIGAKKEKFYAPMEMKETLAEWKARQ